MSKKPQDIVCPQGRDTLWYLSRLLEEAIELNRNLRRFTLQECKPNLGAKMHPKWTQTLSKCLELVKADPSHNVSYAARKIFYRGCGYTSVHALEMAVHRRLRKMREAGLVGL